MGNALDGQTINCSESEYSVVIPPSGQTCDAFLSPFISMSTGYFETRNDGSCGYCQVSRERAGRAHAALD